MKGSAFFLAACFLFASAVFPWAGMAQDQPAPATPAPPALVTQVAPAAQPAAPAPAPAASATASTSAAPPAPAPAADNSWFTGWFEVGYRWDTGVAGSLDAYRSFVNLGSGPKLLGTEFTLTDPKHRLFDEIRVRAYNWGDEPSETLHVGIAKKKRYEFNADYRSFAYFNDLPSFADPEASRGIMLDEQSLDTRRHMGNYTLDLLPGNWIVPYLAFERDSGTGTGVDDFVSLPNSFPVSSTMYDLTNLYRGGVRIERRKFHVTLEQGGTTFVSNQNQYQGSTNYGNNQVPYFGQTIDLQSLLAAEGIRGSSVYSKGLLTMNVTRWLDLYGQFLFSQPDTNVNYQQNDAGNLVVQNQLLFFTNQAYLVTAAAQLPHTSGSLGGEIRPMKRMRIIENWLTDRLHDNGSANSVNQLFYSPSSTSATLALLESSLASNYSQNEVNVMYDLSAKLTLRAGYRYVWGEADDAVFPAADLVSSDQAKMRSNVGLVGFTYRPMKKITLSGSGEFASSGGAYFQTSLYNYQQIRAKARYQATKTLNLSADFGLLNNHDPQPGVNYEYSSHEESLSLLWTPAKQGWDFEGSYTRSTIYSNIGYLEPESLGPEISLYRDNAHNATALFHLKLGRGKGPTPSLMAGGSLFISSGSRPTAYYQPLAKLSAPWGKRTSVFAQWTYYGYGEAFYLYEGFRTQLVTVGLRFSPWGG
jgi:hypothetical protein